MSARRHMPWSTSPAWPWRTAVAAAAITLGLFLLLPMIEGVRPPPAAILDVRPIDTQPAPPPPPSPPETEPAPQARASAPSPPPPPPLQPLLQWTPSPLQMDIRPGAIALDLGSGFDVAAPSEPVERVFDLREIETPPEPLVQTPPQYPGQARARRIEGHVVLAFVVLADGRIGTVRVLSESPGGVFADAAVRAVERWRFRPGQREGRAVPVRVRQRIDFRLGE